MLCLDHKYAFRKENISKHFKHNKRQSSYHSVCFQWEIIHAAKQLESRFWLVWRAYLEKSDNKRTLTKKHSKLTFKDVRGKIINRSIIIRFDYYIACHDKWNLFLQKSNGNFFQNTDRSQYWLAYRHRQMWNIIPITNSHAMLRAGTLNIQIQRPFRLYQHSDR